MKSGIFCCLRHLLYSKPLTPACSIFSGTRYVASDNETKFKTLTIVWITKALVWECILPPVRYLYNHLCKRYILNVLVHVSMTAQTPQSNISKQLIMLVNPPLVNQAFYSSLAHKARATLQSFSSCDAIPSPDKVTHRIQNPGVFPHSRNDISIYQTASLPPR